MNKHSQNKLKRDIGLFLREGIKMRFGPKSEHKFAKHIGISQGSLSDILNGISFPSFLTLRYIDEKTSIDIRLLLRRNRK